MRKCGKAIKQKEHRYAGERSQRSNEKGILNEPRGEGLSADYAVVFRQNETACHD
jgi:hypothetical protein